jgi:acyl-coenzyme A thioesterase PaaI-like protein
MRTEGPKDRSKEDRLQHLQQQVLAMPMAKTLGLRFTRVTQGAVEVEIPVADAFTFRPGQLQATPVFAIADFAAVSAAGSVLPAGWINATVDATLKLLAPAPSWASCCLRGMPATRQWASAG